MNKIYLYQYGNNNIKEIQQEEVVFLCLIVISVFCPRVHSPWCHSSNLPAGISIVGSCSFRFRDSCKVACKQNGVTKWRTRVVCEEHGKWSSLPICAKKFNLRFLEPVDCDKLPVNIRRKAFCVKVKLTKNGKFCPKPNLPKSLKFLEDCQSKKLEETCEIKCLNTDEMYIISCLNDMQWSPFPKCSCPIPLFSQNIELEEDCTMKKPGENCKIACIGVSPLKKHKYVTCKSNSKWSDEPFCKKDICSQPILPNYLLFAEDCFNKGIGERCKLICKMGGKLIHEGDIKCLEGKFWSRFPTCTCPAPDIREDLETIEDCTSKRTGEKCSIKCKEEFSLLKQNFLLCDSENGWGTQPICEKKNCRNVTFRQVSMYSGKCENKSAGDLCFLSCKRGGKFVKDKNYIICKKNGKWSKPEKCFCPPLIPPEEYVLKENCSEKQPGEICRIACKNGAEVKGKNYVKCDNSTKWVDFPECEFDFCAPPILHGKLQILENCDRKKSGDSCKLSCENGGLLIGIGRIDCDSKRTWSPLPKCTCPKPNFSSAIEFKESCEGKTFGEKCLLSCRSPIPPSTATDFIVCIMEKHWMWSALQNCTCSYPAHLFPYVKLREDCENMRSFKIGKTCSVYCDNGGKLLSGIHITCLAKNKWSSSPFCTCAPPPPKQYVNYGNCSETLPGTTCIISCKKGLIDKSKLLCDNYYNWEKFPECTMIPCEELNFESDLFGFNCSNMVSGDECKVGCINEGRIIGANFLRCIEYSNYMWLGPRAICVCTPPVLTDQHTLKDSCNEKKKGEHCLIGCKMKAVPNAYTTCVMEANRMWTPLIDCG